MTKCMFRRYLLRMVLLTVKLFVIYTLLFFSIPLLMMIIGIIENHTVNFILSLIFIFLPFIMIYLLVDKDIQKISQSDIFPRNYKYYFPERYKILNGIFSVLISTFLIFIVPFCSFTSAAKIQNYIYFHPHHNRQGNYTELTQLLKSKKWEEANKETKNIMLKITKREHKKWLSTRSLETFPCDNLQTIDDLWMNASNHIFGFSIQTEIWKQKNNGRIDFTYQVQDRFKQQVGWSELNNENTTNTIINVNFSSQKLPDLNIPIGYFPTAVGTSLGKSCVGSLDRLWFGQSVGCYQKIFMRMDECKKSTKGKVT